MAPASKPIDVGSGHLAASFGRHNSALLSLLAYHGQWGVVELTGLPAFDEARRGDADETRRYRALMAEDGFRVAWLETADGRTVEADLIDLSDPLQPAWHGRLAEAPVVATTAANPDGSITLSWRLGPAPRDVALVLRVGGRVDRPPMAEITETDPPLPTGAETKLHAEGPRLRVRAPLLSAAFVLDAGDGEWITNESSARLDVPLPQGIETSVSLHCLVEAAPAGTPPPEHSSRLHSRRAMRDERVAMMVDRAIAYVRGCTCVATAAGERVLLTDHRILPLSWTRDAYYQALLLLVADGSGDRERVADHLRWLWRRCERPDGRWVRSHHANGRRKDRAFQADQQLYPMLELADFWRVEGSLPSGVDWTVAVERALAAVRTEIDPRARLLRSTENAADDPAPAPFLAGAQIMLWYVLSRLAELVDARALKLDAADLQAIADTTRAAFSEHLAGDAQPWAYATDGQGTRLAYHDANDLPVALAPVWGFCPPTDPGWQSTMAFGFSDANPGFYGGPRGGLGSRHTPGPWTLGDVQAWIHARVMGDAAGIGVVLDRLAAVAFEDGMLPEAYSATFEPDNRIRHWFAWPGAALGALLLLDAGSGLDRLRAAP